MNQPLDALAFPLRGSRLIEASAGTGKTWTIAALYLRLVLGHGGENAFARPLLPQDILVMTFTRAATRELTERIRARLVQALACFRGEAPVPDGDAVLQGLLDDHADPAEREAGAWRLQLAAESMDDAAIHTIDAWCQRMLREHAFDSGNLFDETLEADERQRRTEAAQDYWRQQVYPLAGSALDALLQVWPTVDALVADMAALSDEPLDPALGQGCAAQVLEQAQAQRQQQLLQLASGWQERAQQLQGWLAGQLAHNAAAWTVSKLRPANTGRWLQLLSDWAAQPHDALQEALGTGATRLTPDGLLDAYKGAPPAPLPQESQALADLLDALRELPGAGTALRLHAAVHVQQRLRWLKRQAGTFGFADMLDRLNAALAGARGPSLRASILAQYPVALVDEFQDTSPAQYLLFDQIYRSADNDTASALLLIGDPKQSIYGFRGADIYSYLQARRATAGRHYMLGTNYRSSGALVQAINHWFDQAEQRAGSGAFRFRSASTGAAEQDDPVPFTGVAAAGRAERFVAQGSAQPALHTVWHAGPGDEPLSAQALQPHLAQCCAEQIVQWLGDATTGFDRPGHGFTRLKAGDIAILVRKKSEADAVRRELQRRGVASVYLSDRESVFTSGEARDLLLWLRAVADPLNTRHLRAALATPLVGLALATLEQLAHDDQALDGWSELLRQLHGAWQRQGILAMLRHSLHRLQLPARWLQDADAAGERRLTNVLHLAELLQNASADLDGEHALIRWLAGQIDSPGGDSDEQVLRLESDADLVQVVTIHKSKGLEYPLVCLPFAVGYQPRQRRNTALLKLPQPGGGHLLRLDYSNAELAQADEERLREDLRLLYVALTRARHALWLGAGPLRHGNGKACINQMTAWGYLLGGDTPLDGAAWWQRLQAWCAGQPASRCERAPEQVALTRLPAPQGQPALHAAPPYRAQFDRRWGIGSFSALVRDLSPLESPPQAASDPLPDLPDLPDAPALHGLATPRPADDEPASQQPVDTALPGATRTVTLAPWHRFPGGPLVGNFLHEQLQWLSDEGFALAQQPAADDPLAAALLRRCERAGHGPRAQDALAWLAAAAHQRLPGVDASLVQLAQGGAHQRLAEMEFWMPVQQLPAARVDALCRAHILPGQERPPLPERSLHGMLMGFADLVFAHQGRYWVLDYKSNRLGADAAAYGADALAQAMLTHRYDVQAALYLLALHRLLGQRLGSAYDPVAQLGGALYYFLRGIDSAAAGVHLLAPPLALLNELQALMESTQPEALA